MEISTARRGATLFCVLCALVGCGDGSGSTLLDDGGPAVDAATPADGGASDAGRDAGAGDDAGSMPDASTLDGGPCATTRPDDPLIAQTRLGLVRGEREGDVIAFRGIPYAATPDGERRFRPPQPAECWSGVRDATVFASVCPQLLPSGSRVGNEDCLFLNVWTPQAGPSASPRPVLFFIHGGAYVIGSGSQDLVLDGSGNLYGGQALADEQDAVVVTINYRLAGLGFLAHPALAAEDEHGSSGNQGILDQIAALEWVRDNIAGFGGDPSRVAIFGESAGGLSVCLLLATPLARGLFSAAIIESGGCNVASQASRFTQGERVARNLGCEGEADVAACLRARPAYSFAAGIALDFGALVFEDVLRAWELPSGPNVDGHVFVEAPMVTLREGRHAQVPLIVGSNANEFELFTPPMATCLDYYGVITALFGATQGGEVLRHYRCLDHPTPRQAAVAVGTDMMFTCPARRIARSARAGGSPSVYRYLFSHTFEGHALALLKAFHTAELPFVFGTFDVLGYEESAVDTALSDSIGGYWARLAETGDPNGAGAATWPLYEASTDPAIHFDRGVSMTQRIRSERCDFWDGITLEE